MRTAIKYVLQPLVPPIEHRRAHVDHVGPIDQIISPPAPNFVDPRKTISTCFTETMRDTEKLNSFVLSRKKKELYNLKRISLNFLFERRT